MKQNKDAIATAACSQSMSQTPRRTEMSTSTSPSGTQLYEHRQDGHVVQFYADDGALLDSLSRFIGTALVAGEAAVVFATQAHRDGLAQRLKTRGFDTESAIQQ